MSTESQGDSVVKHARSGWFKLWREDVDRITDHCNTHTLATICTWIALCDLANQHRSETFEASIGIIRKITGLSRRSVFRALKQLQALGMITRKQNPGDKDDTFTASTYTLVTPSQKSPTPSAKNRPPPVDQKSRKLAQSIKKLSPSGKPDHTC